jgi:hypothetical protein
VSCFGVLGVTNSVQGISIQEKKEWKVIISDVSKLAMDQGAMEVIHEPSFDKYKVNYGLKFINVGHSQFEFTIKNDGDIDAIVNDIKVNGIDNYQNNIEVTLTELKIGDVIKANSMIQVKVLTDYNLQLIDENMIPQLINLENIEIDIDLKKVE